jgi:hypothetical protein
MTSTCSGTLFIVAFATVTGTRNSICMPSDFAGLDAHTPQHQQARQQRSNAPRTGNSGVKHGASKFMMARNSISCFSWR